MAERAAAPLREQLSTADHSIGALTNGNPHPVRNLRLHLCALSPFRTLGSGTDGANRDLLRISNLNTEWSSSTLTGSSTNATACSGTGRTSLHQAHQDPLLSRQAAPSPTASPAPALKDTPTIADLGIAKRMIPGAPGWLELSALSSKTSC